MSTRYCSTPKTAGAQCRSSTRWCRREADHPPMRTAMSTSCFLSWAVSLRSLSMKFRIGSRHASPLFVRRNVPHAFTNRTRAPARMLLFYTPGGVEEFFLAAGRPAIDGVAPPPSTEESRAREVKVASEHHIAPATEIVCQGPCPANPEEQLI